VAVNVPEAGTITQWFVSEEDNVEVGQKLCEIDTEAKPSGGICAFAAGHVNSNLSLLKVPKNLQIQSWTNQSNREQKRLNQRLKRKSRQSLHSPQHPL